MRGFEPPTNGLGSRCATTALHPLSLWSLHSRFGVGVSQDRNKYSQCSILRSSVHPTLTLSLSLTRERDVGLRKLAIGARIETPKGRGINFIVRLLLPPLPSLLPLSQRRRREILFFDFYQSEFSFADFHMILPAWFELDCSLRV